MRHAKTRRFKPKQGKFANPRSGMRRLPRPPSVVAHKERNAYNRRDRSWERFDDADEAYSEDLG